jgi:D-serine deaminase-like pyridoxal phosphate-dependent protein
METMLGRSVTGGEITLPAMTLRRDALEHNLEVMASLARREGFRLAPHVKTTMCPQLIRRQLDAGAWGVTVATVAQARVAVESGATRILIANEVLARPDAAWLASVASPTQLLCLVDSVDGVRRLDAGLRAAGCPRPLGVLVEVGAEGGRAGTRTLAETRDVAHAASAAESLALVGVEGYEGAVGSSRSTADLAAVDRYLDALRSSTVRLAEEGCFAADRPILVSAGGSKFFDRVIERLGRRADFGGHETSLVLRSGCYLVHDHGLYAAATPLGANVPEGERLQPAVELWAEVLSTPEPGLAIVGLGRRDASFDHGLPVLLGVVGRDEQALRYDVDGVVTKLDDQHGYLALDPGSGGLSVGDRLAFGISHPCTTFDKWRQVLLLDAQRRVTQILSTEFH